MHSSLLPCFRASLLAVALGSPALATEYRLEIASDPENRGPAPVVFTVPAELSTAERLQLVSSEGTAEPMPAQWVNRERRTAAFIAPPIAAGKLLSFRLATAKTRPAKPAAECRVLSDALELWVGGKRVLRYNTAVVQPPSGIDPVYRRSGHIHPVYTPDGRVVTAEFPADHLHQHGIFLAWVNTTFEGRKVDFWNQNGRTGHVEHVRTIGTTSGDVFAAFTVELRHSDISAPGGPKPVLKEQWTVRAWNIGQGHVFEIESRQTCVATSALVLNKYHYGGMAFRGTDQWFAGDKDAAVKRTTDFSFLTSDGLGRVEGNNTRPRWVVAQGAIDGRPASLIAMGDPANPRHPEPVRLHPSKPYFVFTPPSSGELRLEPGVEHVFRYRFVVRDTGADPAGAERAWLAFSNPTRVAVQPE